MLLDEGQRSRLTQAVMVLLNSWELPSAVQLELLGLPEGTRMRSIRKYRQGGVLPDSDQTWQRVEHLIGIADALRTSYPAHPEFASMWVKQRNRKLRGRTPLNCMLEDGMLGFVQVRTHLDCAWGWQRDEESREVMA